MDKFKNTGKISRISKISADKSQGQRSNLSRMTSQNVQKKMLEQQYGIKNLSPYRSISKVKNTSANTKKFDDSYESPDVEAAEEGIGSYF